MFIRCNFAISSYRVISSNRRGILPRKLNQDGPAIILCLSLESSAVVESKQARHLASPVGNEFGTSSMN